MAVIDSINARIERAERRYGKFASTHEALGVACEEWDELRSAIKSNEFAEIRDECLDLAAVLIRLHEQLTHDTQLRDRSTK